MCVVTAPSTRLRTTMPRTRPSTTTRSSISVRGYIFTVPMPICRARDWYAPNSSCWPVRPRERRRRGGAGEPRADHDDVALQLVRGIDQLDLGPVALPLLGQGPRRQPGAQFHGQRTTPPSTASGIATYPAVIAAAIPPATPRRQATVGGRCSPSVWSALHRP